MSFDFFNNGSFDFFNNGSFDFFDNGSFDFFDLAKETGRSFPLPDKKNTSY